MDCSNDFFSLAVIGKVVFRNPRHKIFENGRVFNLGCDRSKLPARRSLTLVAKRIHKSH